MKVSIIVGSQSDLPKIQGAVDALTQFNVEFEINVMSAHRSPALVENYVRNAPQREIKVFICGAGLAAHLAGCVAGHTYLPVIGVPLSGSTLGGQDSLLSTVQMPKGVPVATVAIDGSFNAGLLAVQMLALSDKNLTDQLIAHKTAMGEKVSQINEEIQEKYNK